MQHRDDITDLMKACRASDFAQVEKLVLSGAEINARNRNGTTPFMYAKTAALGNGDLSVMKLLLVHGADATARDNLGMTALDYARMNSASVIAYLESVAS